MSGGGHKSSRRKSLRKSSRRLSRRVGRRGRVGLPTIRNQGYRIKSHQYHPNRGKKISLQQIDSSVSNLIGPAPVQNSIRMRNAVQKRVQPGRNARVPAQQQREVAAQAAIVRGVLQRQRAELNGQIDELSDMMGVGLHIGNRRGGTNNNQKNSMQ
jgi:hypothetical protein